jgi:uncharacterized membrane protein YkvA (DUF1232 family)
VAGVDRSVDSNVRIIPPGQRRPRSGFLPLLLALLYGASPIDLIPDLIPLLGWSDDMMVFAIAAIMAFRIWRQRSQAQVPVRR